MGLFCIINIVRRRLETGSENLLLSFHVVFCNMGLDVSRFGYSLTLFNTPYLSFMMLAPELKSLDELPATIMRIPLYRLL